MIDEQEPRKTPNCSDYGDISDIEPNQQYQSLAENAAKNVQNEVRGLCISLRDLLELHCDEEGLTIRSKETITNICTTKIAEVVSLLKKQLSNALDEMYKRENDMRKSLREHFQRLLNTCRVAYCVERENILQVNTERQLALERKMEDHYTTKLRQLQNLLDQKKDVCRVQEKTLAELQKRTKKAEDDLKNEVNKFEIHKATSEGKEQILIKELNAKLKRDVYARFKIMNLNKKLKTTSKSLKVKKEMCKDQKKEIHDLTNKLQVSNELRKRLKKKYEESRKKQQNIQFKRDSHKQNEGNYSSSISSKRKKGENASSRSMDDLLQNKYDDNDKLSCKNVQHKDQQTNTSNDILDKIKDMEGVISQRNSDLNNTKQLYERVAKQNDGYKRLLTCNNIGIILASQHRQLGTSPLSLEAKLLYDVTFPKGILSVKNEQTRGVVRKSSRAITSPHKLVRMSVPVITQCRPSTMPMIEGSKKSPKFCQLPVHYDRPISCPFNKCVIDNTIPSHKKFCSLTRILSKEEPSINFDLRIYNSCGPHLDHEVNNNKENK